MTKYSASVDKLLTYGVFDFHDDWSNYLKLGFTAEDIPALLQMALDEDIYESDDEVANAAPFHAWRILGQLKAEQAILPLLGEIDDDDWSFEELPKILGLIGEKAIAPLKEQLFDPAVNEEEKWVIIDALETIAENYPVHKEQCIAIFSQCLNQITEENSSVAGFAVSSLVDLKATEQIEIIRRAFQQNYVDISIAGDIEDVEIAMGLR